MNLEHTLHERGLPGVVTEIQTLVTLLEEYLPKIIALVDKLQSDTQPKEEEHA